ncbi:uncharacterized protein BX663DRAFT_514143 [Cokeromyces recurvatus]|uniref:uncharacterized protein n=1 Tax=Cokeromyces recurvatus TaxID=90255 RepID=UPI00222115AB|nr:uncharacterized protein BX663DRAFT_514143 [Cokeromyces recurvatus]KAI7901334.1 hypothetical protein BX663DRAFT_514143 [Cokeromyces recurvatus]
MSAKPRSMTAGARNVLRSNDSASLWNCTLSPGWTDEESEILRKALMKFGIGNWAKIIESGCLPGKTNAQMNLQLQRLLGQQSTAEFAGLHIDPKVIGAKNSLVQGSHIKRKNNCIVNTGGKLSREELKKKVIANKAAYELPESEWKNIELPKIEDPLLILGQKKQELEQLKLELEKVQQSILKMKASHPDRMEKLKAEAIRSPTPSTPSTPSTIGTREEEEEKKESDTVDTPNTDNDLAMARALQAEEDELYGNAMSEDDDDDEDFSFSKKRKVTRI